jgi:alcohol dehydrogenase (cytochrome c)
MTIFAIHALHTHGMHTLAGHRAARTLVRRAVAVFALVAAACSHPAEYPITEHARTFNEMNAGLAGAAPPVTQRLTSDRIASARSEPQNWLTYHGAYDGQRYSTLDQITTSNVKQLRPAWIFQAGVIGLIANPPTYSLEATPIVVDGVMFLSGWDGYVWALDAATGRMIWQYKHAIPLGVPLCCGNVNRGVAVAEGKVIVATANGYVVALDARTGNPAWTTAFADVRAGESATGAPLVVKDLVIVGSSGGEYGVRGHIDAFDIATGAHRWRRYNTPKPGEPGADSWVGDSWARGGGSAWVTGTYDPALNLVFWGTGNPGPDFDGRAREGDNLYTNSVIAFSPDDGALKWHYQTTPHDVWDYDGVNEPILFEQDGRKLLAQFNKNGYLFVLDRTTGRLVRATKFADRVTWGDIDPTSGRVTPRLFPSDSGAGTLICPGPAGAKEWPHAAYSQQTELLYTPVVELCGKYSRRHADFGESLPYWGGDVDNRGQESWGYVRAIEPVTGRVAWSLRTKHPMVGSLLTTAGGLVFAGEPTGEFDAIDAKTGALLWQFQTGNGIHGSPVTYSVNGKQYVAIPTGWGGWIKGFAPELYGAPRGSALVVFSLP